MVLLTTHYMEEAHFLSDRVAAIDRGAADGPSRIVLHLPPEVSIGAAGYVTAVFAVLGAMMIFCPAASR